MHKIMRKIKITTPGETNNMILVTLPSTGLRKITKNCYSRLRYQLLRLSGLNSWVFVEGATIVDRFFQIGSKFVQGCCKLYFKFQTKRYLTPIILCNNLNFEAGLVIRSQNHTSPPPFLRPTPSIRGCATGVQSWTRPSNNPFTPLRLICRVFSATARMRSDPTCS